MKVLRSFLPVGQGAFYREAFITKDKDIHNVVYDCGSTSKKIIESAIDREFREGDTVDAVFISHFHSDHINGLKHLVERCNVKNIFFPYSEKKEKGFTKLFCLLEQDDEDEDVFVILDNMENPEEWGAWGKKLKNSDAGIWFVSPETGEKPEEDNRSKKGNRRVVLSGVDCSSIFSNDKCFVWEYVPFNFHQEEKIEKIKKLIEEKKWDSFMNQISSSSLKDFIKNSNNKNWLKNIKEELQVRKWGDDFNTNSMVVFSGSKNHSDLKYQYLYFKKKKICHCCSCLGVNKHTGCLYTGDYDAINNWQELEGGFNKYWDRIGCLQIPHHGSSHSYNSKIIEKIDESTKCLPFCIISAGEKNKYDHPHSYVIKDLVLRDCLVNVVTEDGNSRIDLEIYDSDY